MTTVLHIEDDALLAESVQDAFEAFGFRGRYVAATTLAEAREILQAPPSNLDPDLIISDMVLPDGNGLEIVRLVRADPLRWHIPIVILSGDVDHTTVNRAYVLGANSYLGKAKRNLSLAEVIRDLYAHWLRDAQLPSPPKASRTARFTATSVGIRTRFAAAYLKIAETLGAPDAELWMDLALREGNFANLIEFLTNQLGNRELPPDVLDTAVDVQRAHEEQLTMLEGPGVHTREEAERYLRLMISNIHGDAVALVLANLFPVVPVAMSALRHSGATAIEHIADWIEAHSSDADLRSRVPKLRADAAQITGAAR